RLFDGVGSCFLELGKSKAAKIEGHFLAQPEPQIRFHEPAAVHAAAKRDWERTRLEEWFGDS
ncbi:MAG: NAD(P)/FAD-dependent oxidoreductase, partial [Candidatus Eisenbacteria bacterium]|nr:NAD(P)/FAD-dependent oxidoreductase [Candidatus Eisenbacteria bacterium]